MALVTNLMSNLPLHFFEGLVQDHGGQHSPPWFVWFLTNHHAIVSICQVAKWVMSCREAGHVSDSIFEPPSPPPPPPHTSLFL